MLTKKRLAIKLSKLKNPEKFNLSLEQYVTPSEIAADILWIAKEDIINKTVCDIGCGNGIFCVGAALLGSKQVFGIDIDEGVLSIAKKNAEGLNITLICCDVSEFNNKVDTVIMNPPFMNDKTFLIKAFNTGRVIYSLHRKGTERFIKSLSDDYCFDCELLKNYDFLIPNIYPHHKKHKAYVSVGLWKFIKS